MPRQTSILLPLILIAATLVVYVPVWHAGFVDFDDFEYVTGNEHVTSGLSGANAWWAFTHSHSANWHPLTWLSHMADVQCFGMQARYHHVVNVVLHAVNAVLLFWLLRALTGCVIPSFLVAGLFAVHPVNVEAVAWIAQRKTTLSTLFALLTIAAYARYVRRGDRRYYVGSLALFGLSLLCKQTWVTMPLVLLLLDYWPLERPPLQASADRLPNLRWLLSGWWRLVPDKIPYLLLAIGVSVITVLAQQQALNSIESYPLTARLGNSALAYVGYLVSLVWPVHLAVFYPLYVEEITLPRVLAALALLVALTVACVWLGLRHRYLLVGWLWFLGTLVPVIGLVHVGAQASADRYLYSSCWGLLIVTVWGTRDLLAHWLAYRSAVRVLAGAGAVAFGLLGWLTFQQAKVWEDTITLFTDAAADTERNWLAHRSLAEEYQGHGDQQLALFHCREAAKCGKAMGQVLAIQGLALYEIGEKQPAIDSLRQATSIDPKNSLAFTNLGWIYTDLGKYDLAADQLAIAARYITTTDTPYARRTVYANWGLALANQNHLNDAVNKYEQALAIEPGNPALLRDVGELYLRLHDNVHAVERLQLAASLDPADAKVALLLSNAQLANGDPSAAMTTLEKAASLQPNNVELALQVANLLMSQRQTAAATKTLERVLAALNAGPQPAPADVVSTILARLGDIALAADDLTAAQSRYEQALAAWPDNFAANNNLAWLLATHRDKTLRNAERAVTLARKACDLLPKRNQAALGTLAAALAAGGQTELAAATAREALQLAREAHDDASTTILQKQLEQYNQGLPYFER